MKHATVVLVASLLAHTVFAQTRERPTAQLSFGAAQIEVTATPTAVRVLVIGRPDRVPIYLTRAEAAVWADSAERLLSNSRAPTVNLHFSTEHVVNTVLAAVDTSQARTFIEAVRRAAIVSGEMDKGDLRIYFLFQVEKPAEMLPNSPKPDYPRVLERSGIGGGVQAQFVVTRAGTPDIDSFKVLKSTNELFTQAVRSVLPRMRYSPGMIGGKPVNQLVQQSFQFAVPR